jgi:hypothetical protein
MKFNQAQKEKLNHYLLEKKAERENKEKGIFHGQNFNQFTGLYTNPTTGKQSFADGSDVEGVNTWVGLESNNMIAHKKHHHHHHMY